MTVRGFMATAMLLALAVSGCTAPEDGETEIEAFDDDLEDRAGPPTGEFWEWHPNRPGNGDIEVHEGEDADVPDCIIWDIDGASVTRQVQTGLYEDRFVVDDNEIFESDGMGGLGALQCSVVQGSHPSGKVFQLEDAGGQVLLTMLGRYVFIGDVEVPPIGGHACGNLLQHEVAFSFKKDQIFDGPWWDGNVIATSDAKIAKANPMRRMLLGALVAGECGSAGL